MQERNVKWPLIERIVELVNKPAEVFDLRRRLWQMTIPKLQAELSRVAPTHG